MQVFVVSFPPHNGHIHHVRITDWSKCRMRRWDGLELQMSRPSLVKTGVSIKFLNGWRHRHTYKNLFWSCEMTTFPWKWNRLLLRRQFLVFEYRTVWHRLTSMSRFGTPVRAYRYLLEDATYAVFLREILSINSSSVIKIVVATSNFGARLKGSHFWNRTVHIQRHRRMVDKLLNTEYG
jgi:hypothetical protein